MTKTKRKPRQRLRFFFEEGIDQRPLAVAIAAMFGRSLRPLVWARPTGESYYVGERVYE